MKFSDFSQYLLRLENTPKRLEITAILSELIEKLDVDEIDKALYLSLGYLKAPYESERFNIADKMMIRALDIAYPHDDTDVEELFKEMGDLGNVTEKLHTKKTTTTLTVLEIHEKLLKIATTEGTGSQDKKTSLIAEILHKVDALSAKYIVRIILGTTRLGFTELTIVAALSEKNPKTKKLIESKYFVHPDIGLIAKKIKQGGIKALDEVSLEPGIPVLSQKAQRLGGVKETVEKLKDCWVEFKFDGTRVQLHLDKNKLGEKQPQKGLFDTREAHSNYMVKTFTRNLEDSTHQFPDLVQAAKIQLNADSVILDGEALGIDKDTGEFLPFQEIMQRKRKHAVKEMASEIPIRYFAFDILYLNGEPLVNLPLSERHKILESIIQPGEEIAAAEFIRTESVAELTKYYTEAKERNLEGLIVKKPEDPYKAGGRSYSWVKLKKADERLVEDSVDAVVLGYYNGKGDRSKFGIGGFLIGVYDEAQEIFVTVSKVGTGLKDEDFIYLKKEADKHLVKDVPKNVDIPKMYIPDVIVAPEIVVEIGADEISVSKTHSAGFALRFPRLLFFRTDKNSTQATNLEEIKDLHALQKRGVYKK